MEEQEATWGGLHGAVCLLMLVQEARAGAGEVLGQEHGWSHRGSSHFTDEQLFFVPFFLPPALCWHGGAPFPPKPPCGPSRIRFCKPQQFHRHSC